MSETVYSNHVCNRDGNMQETIILQYCAARLHCTQLLEYQSDSDLADEPEVVAHKHHTPLERIDGIG